MRLWTERPISIRQWCLLAALSGFASVMVGGAFDRAQAQVPNINLMPELKSKTAEEKEQEAIADKAYRESLRKIPNQSVNDPWGNVRGVEAQPTKAAKPAPKPAPKATQAKTQTKPAGATN